MTLIKWLIAMAALYAGAFAAIAGVVLLPHPGGLVLYCAGLVVMLANVAVMEFDRQRQDRARADQQWRAHAREVIERWDGRK